MSAKLRLSILLISFFAMVSEAMAETIQITSRSGARFRASPQGKRIGGVPKGAKLTVLERRGGWVKVKYSGTTGWLYTPRAARTIRTETAENPPVEVQPQPQQDATPPEISDEWVTGEVQGQPEMVEEPPVTEDLPDPVLPSGGQPGAMRYDTVAAAGKCLVDNSLTDAQAKSLLQYYKIKTPGSTAEERINLAKGLFQASALYGGRFEPFIGATIKFSSRTGYSRYTSGNDTVDLNRCNKRGKNCGAKANINPARLIHELGHRFGHQKFRGKITYYDYFASKLKRCHMTGYSDNNLVENVAETISAFITRPERLSAGSKACKANFEFLKTQVFKKNGAYASCSPEGLAALRKSILGLDGNNNVALASDYSMIFGTPPALPNASDGVVQTADAGNTAPPPLSAEETVLGFLFSAPGAQ